MLPSGYVTCQCVAGVYDSGVLAQSGLTINGLFVANGDGYYFGARNANSNASAGQLGLMVTIAGTSYFCYNNGRQTVSPTVRGIQYRHVYVADNVINVNSLRSVSDATRTATTFTGARTMYIGAMNNAGALLSACGGEICGFVIQQGNTVLADLEPAYRKSDGVYGMYDHVSETFLTSLTTVTNDHYLTTVAYTNGGVAYAKTVRGEKVNEIVGGGVDYSIVNLYAEAKVGYSFVNWTDSNGNILSSVPELSYTATQDDTITANFEKNAIDLNMNYRAKALPKDYASGNMIWMNVLSASVNEDMLQKQTSTFKVDSIPSALDVGQVFYLYSPRGENIYSGIVSEIKENEVVCREPLSIYDQDYMFLTTLLESGMTVMGASIIFANRGLGSRGLSRSNGYTPGYPATFSHDLDLLLWSKTRYIRSYDSPYRPMSLYYSENINTVYSGITENEITNLEDKLLEMSSDGIYFDTYQMADASYDGYMFIQPKYYKENDAIQISDNLENITNIDIVSSGADNTVLTVYNSTGTTLRGMYAVTKTGYIRQYNFEYETNHLSDFIGYDYYLGNIVMSDDKIEEICTQNLASEDLNHKITFDIQFNEMLPMNKLKVGTPVYFYVGSKLYKTVITAISYDILANLEEIANAKITLGNVRTNLTSKLNMRTSNATQKQI